MMSIFVNNQENRLRAGWRILLFLILFWILALSVFVVKPLMGDIGRREFIDGYSILVISLIALSASIAVPLARKYLDKRSFISLGLQFDSNTWKDLLFGFALSGAMAGSFLLAVYGTGLIEFNGLNISEEATGSGFLEYMKVMSVGVMFILFIEHVLVGYWEELVFRGYLFQNMRSGMGLTVAIMISCLIYGLVHYLNPNATWVSTGVIVLFGYLRIYGYLATKMLWLSMGMHIGWNFFQGPVFGFGASGHQMTTLFDITPVGPEWLSGGAFGPEGSILIVPVLFLAILAMRWWSYKDASRRENKWEVISA